MATKTRPTSDQDRFNMWFRRTFGLRDVDLEEGLEKLAKEKWAFTKERDEAAIRAARVQLWNKWTSGLPKRDSRGNVNERVPTIEPASCGNGAARHIYKNRLNMTYEQRDRKAEEYASKGEEYLLKCRRVLEISYRELPSDDAERLRAKWEDHPVMQLTWDWDPDDDYIDEDL